MKTNLGYLIKINRKLQKLGLRDLSKRVDISHVQINKYENGIDKTSDEAFLKLSTALNISHSTLFDSELLDLYNHTIEEIFYCSVDDSTIIEKLKMNENKYLNSSYSHIYILLTYIFMVRTNNRESVKYSKILDSLQFSTNHEIQIHLTYKGVYEYLNHNYTDSIYYFQKALSLDRNTKICALIHYYYTMPLTDLNNFTLAIEQAYDAIAIFRMYNAFYRATMCEMIIANIYSNSRRYVDAYRVYTELLSKLKSFDSSKLMQEKVKFNIAIQLINQKRFEESLNIIESIDSSIYAEYKLIEIRCLLYAMMKNYENALIWIYKGLKIVEVDSIDHKLLKIYKLVASKSTTKYSFNSIVSLYTHIEDRIASEMKLVILKWIIDLAEERKDILNAYIFLKQRSEILEKG